MGHHVSKQQDGLGLKVQMRKRRVVGHQGVEFSLPSVSNCATLSADDLLTGLGPLKKLLDVKGKAITQRSIGDFQIVPCTKQKTPNLTRMMVTCNTCTCIKRTIQLWVHFSLTSNTLVLSTPGGNTRVVATKLATAGSVTGAGPPPPGRASWASASMNRPNTERSPSMIPLMMDWKLRPIPRSDFARMRAESTWNVSWPARETRGTSIADC